MTKWVWRGNGIITNNFTNRDYDLRSASNCEAIVKHLNNESERADMNLEMYNDMLTQKREVQEENKRLLIGAISLTCITSKEGSTT